jgi:hypothetical protein
LRIQLVNASRDLVSIKFINHSENVSPVFHNESMRGASSDVVGE